jgi:hypothetical protein
MPGSRFGPFPPPRVGGGSVTDLKPCPFCGAMPIVETFSESCFDKPIEEGGKLVDVGRLQTCVCVNRHYVGRMLMTEWNRRPIEDALSARVAELEERIFDAGREHDAKTCKLGAECPWCEIARLEAENARLREGQIETQETLRVIRDAAQGVLRVSDSTPEGVLAAILATVNRGIMLLRY